MNIDKFQLDKKKIDIIVPCFNESQVLDIFVTELKKSIFELHNYNVNVIFVDDGSSDNTIEIIKKYSISNSNIKFISFSRNFGKESAMYAGLKNSDGDYVLIMDADMQNPPEIIGDMIKAVDEEGFDCCSANRTRDGEPKLRTFFSKRFYGIVNKISEVDMPDGAGDFRMMNRKMVNAILSMSEVQRFSKGIFSWVGFKTKNIYFRNRERACGTSKWNFFSLFKYAIDGITAFSTIPLKAASVIGLIISSTSFIYLIYVILKTLLFEEAVPGYPTIVSLILFIGGIIILFCGILGEYISKIYIEVKRRPIYIVSETNMNIYKDEK